MSIRVHGFVVVNSSSTEHIEAVIDHHVLCEGLVGSRLLKREVQNLCRPRKRHNLTAVQHDLRDAVKVVEEYHHELVEHFYHLYLNNFASELMVEHRVKKLRAT